MAAAAAARPRLGRAHPNPFNPEVALPVTAAQSGPLTLLVYDASGRLVRTLPSSARAGETVTVLWDGKNARGRRLGSGIYLVRIAGVRGEETKIALLE